MVKVSDPWGAFGSGMLPANPPETWMVLLRVFTLEVLPALPAVDCCASTLPELCDSGICWALGVDDAPSWEKPGWHTNSPVAITRLSTSRCFLGRLVFISALANKRCSGLFSILSARCSGGRLLAGSVFVQQKGAQEHADRQPGE